MDQFAGDHHHHHRDGEEEEEDDEEEEEGSEEMLMMNNINNNRVKMVEALSQVQIQPTPTITITSPQQSSSNPRYRECLRNHAINVMGHALDGCGEFMPGGPEGSVEALKCAACGCHRNFHRKEEAGDHSTTALLYSHPRTHSHGLHRHHQHPAGGPFGSYYRSSTTTTTTPSGYLHLGPPPHPRPLALPSASGGGGRSTREEEEDDNVPHNGVGGGGVMVGMGNGKKRFRTKFTAEQKERMLGMAERIGWRIQKCDEDLVQQFCNETAVKRHVFKVWMHNNKHTLGKTTTTTNTTSSNAMNNNNNNSSSSNNSTRQQLMS